MISHVVLADGSLALIYAHGAAAAIEISEFEQAEEAARSSLSIDSLSLST
jgi:hypothetical protein